MIKREEVGFVFMPSYYDAIRSLPKNARLAAYDAICDYAFLGEPPETLPGAAKPILQLILPILDYNLKKYETKKRQGKGGGNPNFSKGKANPYYETDHNFQDNFRDNFRDNRKKEIEIETEKETDIEREKETATPLGSCGNVFLSPGEQSRLKKLFPNSWESQIEQLSQHLNQGNPLPRPGHYASILALFEQSQLGL